MKLTNTSHRNERGNTVAIVLVVLAVAAIGVLAFLSNKMSKDQTVTVAEQSAVEDEAVPATPAIEIKPGNPVVATVNGQDILRIDVVNYIQTLPLQTRQLPLDQLFPAAVNQLVNENLAKAQSKKARLDKNPIVKERLAAAKAEIVATVFLQEEVSKKTTDEQLKNAYNQYVAALPEVEEARASHILVEKRKDALKLIQQLEDGADFAELAKENSIDKPSADRGGDIGYFTKTDVVPEFADKAFSMDIGTHTFEPVKSQFGYHVIMLADKRIRPTPTFEEAKPAIIGQARQAVLQSLFAKWRSDAKIEVFDINGEVPAAVEPAAGEIAPAAVAQ